MDAHNYRNIVLTILTMGASNSLHNILKLKNKHSRHNCPKWPNSQSIGKEKKDTQNSNGFHLIGISKMVSDSVVAASVINSVVTASAFCYCSASRGGTGYCHICTNRETTSLGIIHLTTNVSICKNEKRTNCGAGNILRARANVEDDQNNRDATTDTTL